MHDVSPNTFLAVGLSKSSSITMCCIVFLSTDANLPVQTSSDKTKPTTLQMVDLQQKRNTLQRRIVAWQRVQAIYMPATRTDSENDTGQVRGLAMEPFAAFLLGFQFSSFRPLCDVFTFVGTDRPLFHREAHLVALQRVNGRLEVYSVDLSNPLQGTTYRHGHSPSTPTEFAEWVLNPNRIPFCFPPNLVGPDICFALLLDNGQLL
jgi:hypothetical protein